MKILDVKLFEQVVTDTQSALKEKSEQITDPQQAIDSFVNMEGAFKDKAGNTMHGYFRDFHQPYLLYLQSFLSEYNEQLNKVLKDLSAFESSGIFVYSASPNFSKKSLYIFFGKW
ncbi:MULTISPECIES: T7SS effector LXG polymorphic toxin [Heyndrickxia]|jgi:predicted ribonuclease toxin of YeeF-YezG toxin-antitoxin module|uniref:T7SS effector LXG polymorphic toxin n=1 Tax=Heyndrickxia TaxID=2837504 RepID=UPI000779959C|nr:MULTISPECIES: T7SS effector LXG polymorphic toxin [Heyndrickxia]KYC72956.1 hypothetical protein B4096_3771 [Heyndrickxia coagulans]MED4978065.1 T7SS effector LXG polymorphic toxin [Weizmannia sp. CD-2023]